jgi:arylsulfatase A-like enzyme
MRRAVLFVVFSCLVAASCTATSAGTATAESPDIILIVSDDQTLNTLQYMPLTTEWLPTRFESAFVSMSLCCPSRAAIFSGRYAHDTGVWANGGPYGGPPPFAAWDANNTTINEALDQAGYRTGLFGKFILQWDPNVMPSGWDEVAMRKGGTPYYNYSLIGVRDGAPFEEAYGEEPADYLTTVLTDKAVRFIGDSPSDEPMFLFYAPSSPHSAKAEGQVGPTPAPEDLNAQVELPPFTPNFNEEDVSDKPAWIQALTPRPENKMIEWRTNAARTLLSLDRSVDQILTAQEVRDPGLDNTVVLFISDNGFANGTHRLNGKGDAYEESIHVPLLMRAPGLGATEDGRLVANIDIASTIADAAGVAFDSPDGLSLLSTDSRDFVVLEGGIGTNHAFCGVRTLNAKYVKYMTGEVEFYNLAKDPYELRSRPDARRVERLAQMAGGACSPLPPEWPRPTL